MASGLSILASPNVRASSTTIGARPSTSRTRQCEACCQQQQASRLQVPSSTQLPRPQRGPTVPVGRRIQTSCCCTKGGPARVQARPPVTRLAAARPPVSRLPAVCPAVSRLPTARPSVSRLPTARPPVSRVPAACPAVSRLPAACPAVSRLPAARPSVSRLPAARPPVSRLPAARPPVSRLPAARPSVSRVPAARPSVSRVPAARPAAAAATVAPACPCPAPRSSTTLVPRAVQPRQVPVAVPRRTASGTVRAPAPVVSRVPAPGAVRAPAPRVARVPVSAAVRAPAPRVARVPVSAAVRAPAPAVARAIRAPGSGVARIPRATGRPTLARPVARPTAIPRRPAAIAAAPAPRPPPPPASNCPCALTVLNTSYAKQDLNATRTLNSSRASSPDPSYSYRNLSMIPNYDASGQCALERSFNRGPMVASSQISHDGLISISCLPDSEFQGNLSDAGDLAEASVEPEESIRYGGRDSLEESFLRGGCICSTPASPKMAGGRQRWGDEQFRTNANLNVSPWSPPPYERQSFSFPSMGRRRRNISSRSSSGAESLNRSKSPINPLNLTKTYPQNLSASLNNSRQQMYRDVAEDLRDIDMEEITQLPARIKQFQLQRRNQIRNDFKGFQLRSRLH